MTALPFVVAAVTFLLAVGFLQRRRADDARRRVSALVAPRRTARVEQGQSEAKTASQLDAFELWLARRAAWNRLAGLLERADIRLRPAYVAGAIAGGTLFLALLGSAGGMGVFGALLLLVGAAAAARLVLATLVERRRRAFEEQLPEFLASLASALRAGHSLNQAIAAVAADSPQPLAGEFERVLAEARLGRPIEDAFADLGTRIRSDALEFVLDAILIQRQVGGSLASIFEVVAESVRQRQQFALRVRALTSMARLSARVLLALPVALAAGMTAVNPGYLAPLVRTPSGHKLIGVGLVLLGLGWVWLRRIAATGAKTA